MSDSEWTRLGVAIHDAIESFLKDDPAPSTEREPTPKGWVRLNGEVVGIFRAMSPVAMNAAVQAVLDAMRDREPPLPEMPKAYVIWREYEGIARVERDGHYEVTLYTPTPQNIKDAPLGRWIATPPADHRQGSTWIVEQAS